MIIIKLFGCVLVFISCTLFGYTLKNKFVLRVSDLENMISCMTVFENEIRISMRDMQSASAKVLNVAKDINFCLFSNLADDIKNNDGQTMSELWKKTVSSVCADSHYLKEDINTFMRFGDVLGSGDAQSQIDNLQNFRSELSGALEDAKQCVKQKGGLLGKVGVYIGIITVILLI